MNRLQYISNLNKWLIDNPEVYVQQVLPKCILEEIYYYQHHYQRLNNERSN